MDINNMYKRSYPYLIIILCFIVSVFIRIPNLDRPLSKHHEFCTANYLRFLKVWEKEGIGKSKFNLVCNYTNSTDKNINNYSSNLMDKSGNYYYISFPPFSYIFPYIIFQVLDIRIEVFPTQILNMILQFISCIFIYLIVRLVLNEKSGQISFPALAASLLYIFSPANLWLHSNIHAPEIFSQHILIICTFFALRIIYTEGRSSIANSILLGLFVLICIYSGWIGLFFSMIYSGYLAYNRKTINQSSFHITVCLTATIFSLALIIYQYSLINNYELLIEKAQQRFMNRSGLSTLINQESVISDVIMHLSNFIRSYLFGYLPLLAMTMILISGYVIKFRKLPGLSRSLKQSLYIILLPPLLFHLLFLEASGHYSYAIKGGFALCVFTGLIINRFVESGIYNIKKVTLQYLVLVTICLCSISQYYYINPLGEYSLNGFKYSNYKDIGIYIGEHSSIDEVVFIKGSDPLPQILVYAERNILKYQDDKKAISFLKEYDHHKAVVFEIDKEYEPKVLKRITI